MPLIVIGGALVLLFLVAGVWLKFRKTTQAPVDTSVQGESTSVATPTQQAAMEGKAVTVKGANFSFAPSKITVKQGEKVKIVFQDDDGFHDLVIDGYDVKTQRIQTGGSSQVEFTADKIGTFEYFCSVDGHREKGMKGVLTVQ